MKTATWLLFCLLYSAGASLGQDLCPHDGSETGARSAFLPIHGIELNFPNGVPDQATINAFIIFVQHRDTDFDNDWTDDPVTEWPADWSSDANGRRLPAWAGIDGEALLAPPGTDPADFAEGSLSQFYHLMSNENLILTGDVYPQVYVPEQTPDEYVMDPAGDPTAALALSREILTSPEITDYFDLNYPGNAINIFDQYTNGEGDNLTPDGEFDMIILLFRFSALVQLRENCTELEHFFCVDNNPATPCLRLQCGRQYTSVTNFGTFNLTGGTDTFQPNGEVHIGSLRVVDNGRSGSGVIGGAYTMKAAIRIMAHEIGHRHFYLFHTCDTRDRTTTDAECVGIMSGGPFLTFSAPDRLKLDWVDVTTVDISTLTGTLNQNLPALTEDANEVLRLQDGGTSACGDIIVEARTWSNFWDSPPDGANDDGDPGDFFLPQEGLYFYKAAAGGACGGGNFFYSSLESNGVERDPGVGFRFDSIYQAGFEPGDAYLPFSRFEFDFHENAALDDHVGITNIQRSADGFSFDIWNEYPLDELNGIKTLTDDHTFGDQQVNLARGEMWTLNGPFALNGDFIATNGSTVTIQDGGTIDLVAHPDNPGNTIVLQPGNAMIPGAVMTFEMGSTLTLGAHATIEVLGILDGVRDEQDGLLTLQDGVDFVGNCAELISTFEGRIEFLDDMMVPIPCACTLPRHGGIVSLAAGQSLTYQNDAFMANDKGTYRFEDNTTVQLMFSANPMLITPGSAFELGSGASFQIKSDPADTQNLVGTVNDPITFTGGEVVFDGVRNARQGTTLTIGIVQ